MEMLRRLSDGLRDDRQARAVIVLGIWCAVWFLIGAWGSFGGGDRTDQIVGYVNASVFLAAQIVVKSRKRD